MMEQMSALHVMLMSSRVGLHWFVTAVTSAFLTGCWYFCGVVFMTSAAMLFSLMSIDDEEQRSLRHVGQRVGFAVLTAAILRWVVPTALESLMPALGLAYTVLSWLVWGLTTNKQRKLDRERRARELQEEEQKGKQKAQ
eukprot:TRINITY_DN5956_c0_g1_i1.p2 TRINITY_DN5956_c0_g1~~TRINITY_DN5956_c0_g1_i1.p2  ORF type:complete len:139 (-),score=51.16 TRINITY_DN5956_c0_g1_i1:93-509(-)